MGIGPQDSGVDKDPDPELSPRNLLFPFFETVVSLSCPGCLWTHSVIQARPWTCHLPTLSRWDDWCLSIACLIALSLPNCLVIKQWVNVVVLLVQSCCCGFFPLCSCLENTHFPPHLSPFFLWFTLFSLSLLTFLKCSRPSSLCCFPSALHAFPLHW